MNSAPARAECERGRGGEKREDSKTLKKEEVPLPDDLENFLKNVLPRDDELM